MFSGTELKSLLLSRPKGEERISQKENSYLLTVLVQARTGMVFAVARRGHGWDREVVLYHLMSLSQVGRRESPPGGRSSFQWSKCGGSSGVMPVSSQREQWE